MKSPKSLTDDCISSFNSAVLEAHNKYRVNHRAVRLVANKTINKIALKYSNYLAVNNIFQHSGTDGLGENLAAIFYSSKPNVNSTDCAGKTSN
jgi:uncharacterized protein YkwD